MAIHKYISSKKIISDVFRDIIPSNSDWVHNAIEWINFGLNELGGGFNMIEESEDLTIVNHKVKAPCYIDCLRFVTYDGRKLPKLATVNIDDFDRTGARYYTFINDTAYIKTSFESGDITIYYKKIAIDEDGFPLVPDGGQMAVRNYLQEYILMKWLAQGNVHPVRKYNEVKFGIYTRFGDGSGLLQRATNICNFPTIDDMELVRNSLVTLLQDTRLIDEQRFDTDGKDAIMFDSVTPEENDITTYTELVESNIGDTPCAEDIP